MALTFINRILLILIFAFSTLVNAQEYTNPYQGSVLAGGTSEAHLKEQALKQVLVKVSGNTQISHSAETKRLLKNAQQMISQYGYRSIAGNKYFSAVFDQKKVNQALKDMQQPVWGNTRPITLIWLVNNNKLASENQIKSHSDNSLSSALEQTESDRGIRLQFPLMDLEDNLALSVSDVKGRFYSQVSSASKRYELNHFVAAELHNMGNGRWKLKWQLVQAAENSAQSRSLVSEDYVGQKSVVMKKMVNAIADYYASQYAVVDNNGEKFKQLVNINGINSLTELSKLDNVLDNLQVISSYKVIAAQGQQVSLEVKINGSVDSFENTLSAHPHLLFDRKSTNAAAQLTLEATDESESTPSVDNTNRANTSALYFNWR